MALFQSVARKPISGKPLSNNIDGLYDDNIVFAWTARRRIPGLQHSLQPFFS
jgi:hypothetical protein